MAAEEAGAVRRRRGCLRCVSLRLVVVVCSRWCVDGQAGVASVFGDAVWVTAKQLYGEDCRGVRAATDRVLCSGGWRLQRGRV